MNPPYSQSQFPIQSPPSGKRPSVIAGNYAHVQFHPLFHPLEILRLKITNALKASLSPKIQTMLGMNPFGLRHLSSLSVEESNPNFVFEDGTFFDEQKTHLILCIPSKNATYAIPDTVQTANDYAIAELYTLKEVKVSASIESIGRGAFPSCDGLRKIELPP